MDLSVVVCTYNRADKLVGTLNALVHQQTPFSLRWEIVVVDNNSTDRTREVVERCAAASAVPVKYAFEPTQGLSHARNRGIRESAGNVVAFTDDDVLPPPNWAHGICTAITRWRADGIGGRILPKWATRPPRWLADRHLWGALAVRDSEEWTQLRLDASGRFANGAEIWGANMAFRRSLFDAIGVFDPSLGHRGTKLVGGEETEFIRRAVAAGRTLVYDPSLVVWHCIGPERMEKRFFRRKCFDIGHDFALRFPPRAYRRRILGIPLYQVRFCVSHMGSWLAAMLRRDSERFCKELEIWKDLGFMVACLTASAEPRKGRNAGD